MLRRIPDLLALETILLLTLAGFAGSASADIHLKDTYYVFPLRHALSALALGSGLLFLICFLAQRVLRLPVLSAVHVLGTLMLFTGIEVLLYQSVYNFSSGAAISELHKVSIRSEWLQKLCYALALWQILLPVNFALSMRSRFQRN